MCVKLLTDHHLEFLSLKGGCIGSSESTPFKLDSVAAHLLKFCSIYRQGPKVIPKVSNPIDFNVFSRLQENFLCYNLPTYYYAFGVI